MLRAMIISEDQEAADALGAALTETGRAGVVRVLQRYPTGNELMRILRAQAPQVFLIDVELLKEALAVASTLATNAPNAQVVAFARRCEQRTLLELMRAGIREFVGVPDGFAELPGVLDRAAAALERAPAVCGKPTS